MREAVGLLLLAAAILISMLPRLARGEDGEPRLLYFPVADEPETASPKLRRVLFFTAAWCSYCPAAKAEMLEYLGTSPVAWRIDETDAANVQIVDSDRRPDLVRLYQVGSLPQFVLIDGRKVLSRGGRDKMKSILIEYATKPTAGRGSDVR